MHIRDTNGKMLNPEDVVIGNVKCEREVHLVVYISQVFKPVTIMWSNATSKGQSIKFEPESAFVESVIYPINVNETTMPLLPLEDMLTPKIKKQNGKIPKTKRKPRLAKASIPGNSTKTLTNDQIDANNAP